MYGGSGKLGRGGGFKRNIHSTLHPSPLQRPSSAAAPSGRLSTGGAGAAPRNRTASASVGGAAAVSAGCTEESFSLVTGNPLNFGMIIRLAPNLVEEIKRVESQGSVARIKFDANANNPAGNVIKVGGKDFRFTWPQDTGDLCDIYEERQSGEDGNGLLVESGCAWRKLTVQRVLDESTKNHVKMLSEEAEHKLKLRRSIVLDPGNPTVKSQMKALAAAESNPWRMKGAPPFKKRKAEPPHGGPPKSVQKSVLTTTPPSKGRPPISPPPPAQSGPLGSPFRSGNLMKGHANVEDIVSGQAISKAVSSEKDTTGKVITSADRGKPEKKGTIGVQPIDLQRMLISLLKESPSKGMSFKAIEKAIGDAIPNSARQIEPILKKIATFQAPGRYFLKPGVEIESFKKPLSEGQSSPEDNRHPSPANDDQQSAPDTSFPMISDTNELEEQAELDSKYEEAPTSLTKGGVLYHSTDLFGEKRVSGPVGSSGGGVSDSDSDSDSESDSSGGGSHSKSQSRSPAGSGSGSSSDSESDASTNSKEASDEEVDIMTSDDDNQTKHRLQASGLGSSKSPLLWRTSDGDPAHIGTDEKQDGNVFDVIEIDKDLPEDQSVGGLATACESVPNKEGQKPVEETTPSLYYRHEDQERQDHIRKTYRETGNVAKNGLNHGQSNSSEKASRGKYKRVSDEKHVDDKPDCSKRLKSENSHQPQVSGSRTALFEDIHQNSSPNRPFEDLHKGPNNQMANRMRREANPSFGSQKVNFQTSSTKSMLDSQQPIQRFVDPSAHAKTSTSVEKLGKHSEYTGRGVRHPERLHQMNDDVPMQKDKFNREMQDDYGSVNYKGPVKVSKEDFGEKYKTPVDSSQRKHEAFGNLKEFGSVLNSHVGYSPKEENTNSRDRSVVNGRPNLLQRELSDLELGELREPLPEETPGFNKELDRKSFFKQLENKTLSSENWNSDPSKAKLASKMTADSRKPSSLNTNIPVPGISEGIPNRGVPEHSAEDLSRPHQRAEQSHQMQHQSRVDCTDAGTQHNRVVELSGRNRHHEVGRIDSTSEVHRNFPSKGSATASQEHDAKQGSAPPSRKESRRQKFSAVPELNDKKQDTSLTGSSDGCQRRRESSSEENSFPYSKYEKDEPELKEPIKDGIRYKEYVEEFQEKYGIYCSLNKILESYREEFLKFGRELEASKGKDMERYYDVERQMKESFRCCGERFKRMKKIFVVLHEELEHLKGMIEEFAAPYVKDLKD